MSTPRHSLPRFLAVFLATASMLSAGCVTSEKSGFSNHLSSVVKREERHSVELAMAFGLDDHAKPVLVSAGFGPSLPEP